MKSRTVLVTLLVVSLLLAGVASFYASSHPDGLEHVAEKTGFLDSGEDSATADSPLADYGVEGVDNERLSGGLARSEEHTSELQSLMRISYAVFCLKKKK